MTKNEIVGRLKDGGLDASSTNRSAAVYVTDARSGRAEAGWFAYRIVCNNEETERRARAILSRWYDIEASGDVWRLKSKNRIPLMAIKRNEEEINTEDEEESNTKKKEEEKSGDDEIPVKKSRKQAKNEAK